MDIKNPAPADGNKDLSAKERAGRSNESVTTLTNSAIQNTERRFRDVLCPSSFHRRRTPQLQLQFPGWPGCPGCDSCGFQPATYRLFW